MNPYLLGALLFLAGLIVSTLLTLGVLLYLPEDHFTRAGRRQGKSLALAVLKNLLGAVLVVIGVALSLPGVPGQGLLTAFAGLLLLDIPGKRRLELSLLRRPFVQRVIARLRKRFKKEPLEIPARAKRGKGKSDS